MFKNGAIFLLFLWDFEQSKEQLNKLTESKETNAKMAAFYTEPVVMFYYFGFHDQIQKNLFSFLNSTKDTKLLCKKTMYSKSRSHSIPLYVLDLE